MQMEVAVRVVTDGFSFQGRNYVATGLGQDFRLGGPLNEHVVQVAASRLGPKADHFRLSIKADAMMMAAWEVAPEWAPESNINPANGKSIDLREMEREIRYFFVQLCIMRVLFYMDCHIVPIVRSKAGSSTVVLGDPGGDANHAGLPAPRFQKSGCPATQAGQIRMGQHLKDLLAPLKNGCKHAVRKFAHGLATSCKGNPKYLQTKVSVCVSHK